MVKSSQKICRQQPMNCLSVFGHFAGLALKGLNPTMITFALLISNTQIDTVSLPLKTQNSFCVSNSETSL